MPNISSFYGIVILMFFNDHPPPHFHVEYGEYKALLSIETLEVLEGSLPTRTLSLVLEWASLHRQELREDWELCRKKSPLKKIPPLE